MFGLVFIAALAGVSSALLAGAAAGGSVMGALLVVIAPLPLMIVAIGWHPLLALIGGALTSALLAFAFRGNAGVVFAVLVMVPAYLAANALWRRPVDGPSLLGLIVIGAAGYAALATLVGALSVSFDYSVLEVQLTRQAELMYRAMSGLAADAPLISVGGQDPKLFISTMSNAVGPFVVLILGAIYIVNIWLAAKISDRSGRLPGQWISVPDMILPRVLMPLAAISMLGGLLPGYIGFFLELLSVAAVIALVALGYACVHSATRGTAMRGLFLGTLWGITFVFFGIPFLLMLLAGVAEVAFGWRKALFTNRTNNPN